MKSGVVRSEPESQRRAQRLEAAGEDRGERERERKRTDWIIGTNQQSKHPPALLTLTQAGPVRAGQAMGSLSTHNHTCTSRHARNRGRGARGRRRRRRRGPVVKRAQGGDISNRFQLGHRFPTAESGGGGIFNMRTPVSHGTSLKFL